MLLEKVFRPLGLYDLGASNLSKKELIRLRNEYDRVGGSFITSLDKRTEVLFWLSTDCVTVRNRRSRSAQRTSRAKD